MLQLLFYTVRCSDVNEIHKQLGISRFADMTTQVVFFK